MSTYNHPITYSTRSGPVNATIEISTYEIATKGGPALWIASFTKSGPNGSGATEQDAVIAAYQAYFYSLIQNQT
jgi:hypothetical protein